MAQFPTTRSKTRTVTTKREDMDDFREVRSDANDTEWEDEEPPLIRSDERRAGAGDEARTTPRKRKNLAYKSRKPGSLPPSPKLIPSRAKKEDRSIISREEVVDGTLTSVSFGIRYLFDIFSMAMNLLRKPLGILLFLWILAFIIGRVSHTLQVVFSPFCIIPGISNSPMCGSWKGNTLPGKRVSQWADYPRLMEVQSKSLSQLLDDSVGGSALSLEIKKAEMATKDLVALVRISELKAKDTLASSLSEFVDDARETGRGLQKLSSKVGGAVDNIMAVNDYALNSIESARASQKSSWSLTGLMPWSPPTQKVDEVVRKTFEEAMDVLSNNMERLIIEAEDSLRRLNELEERLATLHETISREDSSISSAQAELLEMLWTKLGGNRKSLRNFENHLILLKGLSAYRNQALSHVIAALQTLRAMSADMEDMRERVAAPNLIGANVPVEVHMKSIQMGLERLREGKVKAKRLEEDAIRRVLNRSFELVEE